MKKQKESFSIMFDVWEWFYISILCEEIKKIYLCPNKTVVFLANKNKVTINVANVNEILYWWLASIKIDGKDYFKEINENNKSKIIFYK